MPFTTKEKAKLQAKQADASAAPAQGRGAAPGGYQKQVVQLRPPEGVEHLQAPAGGPDGATTGWTDNTIAPAGSVLPFDGKGGWDHEAILSGIGQVDDIPETDSDGVRCVQAVAVGSYVVRGPEFLAGYLSTKALGVYMMNATEQADGTIRPATVTPRQEVAARVCIDVAARIRNQTATFGDLSWAMEALHSIARPQDKDNEGTADTDVMDQISADGGGYGGDRWSSHANARTGALGKEPSQSEFLAMVNGMAEGQQLICAQYAIFKDERGRPVGNPSGHQLFVYKMGGKAKVYDPAVDAGKLKDLDASVIGEMYTNNSMKQRFIVVLGELAGEPPAAATSP